MTSLTFGCVLLWSVVCQLRPALAHLQKYPFETPMDVAIRLGRQTSVAKLIASEPSIISKKDLRGDAPLHVSAEYGRISISALLLKKGARVDVLDGNRRTPLFNAAFSDSEPVARVLLDAGVAVDARDSSGATALHCSRSVRLTRLLLSRKAQVDARDNNGATPLLDASSGSSTGVVLLLLAHRANLFARDDWGDSAAHYAAMGHSSRVANLILNKGALVDARGAFDRTPLLVAADQGNLAVARLLVQHGANINAVTHYSGMSALHQAAQKGRLECVKYLLSKGANPWLKNIAGETAGDLAGDYPAILRLIKRAQHKWSRRR